MCVESRCKFLVQERLLAMKRLSLLRLWVGNSGERKGKESENPFQVKYHHPDSQTYIVHTAFCPWGLVSSADKLAEVKLTPLGTRVKSLKASTEPQTLWVTRRQPCLNTGSGNLFLRKVSLPAPMLNLLSCWGLTMLHLGQEMSSLLFIGVKS